VQNIRIFFQKEKDLFRILRTLSDGIGLFSEHEGLFSRIQRAFSRI